MRSAISGLYCSGNRPILPAVGTAEDHRLPSFATVRSPGGGLGDRLRGSEQDEVKPVTAVRCPQFLFALSPVQDLKLCPFDGRSVGVYRTILSRSWSRPITSLRDSEWVLKSTAIDALRKAPQGSERPVTAKVAAEFLQMHVRSITRLAGIGHIPGHPMGYGQRKKWLFYISELDEWLRG